MTTSLTECSECEGEGTCEYERYKYRSFSDDIGGIEIYEDDCDACNGTGWGDTEDE